MRYVSLSIPDATAVITAMPADAATAVAAIESAELRVRPEPATWSVTEYLCHLRDVVITTTIRLHRARTEDRPTLEPMLNDLRARRFRYVDADPHATLAELGRIVGGVSDEIARISADDWARTVTRLPGEERTMGGWYATRRTSVAITSPTSPASVAATTVVVMPTTVLMHDLIGDAASGPHRHPQTCAAQGAGSPAPRCTLRYSAVPVA